MSSGSLQRVIFWSGEKKLLWLHKTSKDYMISQKGLLQVGIFIIDQDLFKIDK